MPENISQIKNKEKKEKKKKERKKEKEDGKKSEFTKIILVDWILLI